MIIPGIGWDTESVVTGAIKMREPARSQPVMERINAYDFDAVFPFTNIFWSGSPAVYGFPIIGFAGSYKQIEEAWLEWLWKFSRLLSSLDAVEAQVTLSCVLGTYFWILQPRLHFADSTAYFTNSMEGQLWGIIAASDPDFTEDPDWISHCTDTLKISRDAWQCLEHWTKVTIPS